MEEQEEVQAQGRMGGVWRLQRLRWCFCFWVNVKDWVCGMERLGQRFKGPGAEGDGKREAPGIQGKDLCLWQPLPVSGWAVTLLNPLPRCGTSVKPVASLPTQGS